jgi:cysteine desulfurase
MAPWRGKARYALELDMMSTNESASPIYLDNNATTPLLPQVVDAMLPFLTTHFGNPSSGHVYGARARAAVETARAQVAALLGCEPEEVFFTSGGTEANNLAIIGAAMRRPDRKHLVTSAVEHPATERPCSSLESSGWQVTRIPVRADCVVAPADARPCVRDDTALVTVMLANNETGALMPIAELAELAHERGAVVHTDAAQAVGKISTRVGDLGVELLSIAGHKLYAPKGVGALYVRKGTALQPLVLGAGHERGLRPGTENVASIVGLGKACEIALGDLHQEPLRVARLRDRLWDRLRAAIPGLRLNGHPTQRLPNTLNVSFPAARGSALLARAPGIAASTGSACHEGGESPSGVLLAMGLDPATALGAVRLSLGRFSSAEQIDQAADQLIEAYRAVTRAG